MDMEGEWEFDNVHVCSFGESVRGAEEAGEFDQQLWLCHCVMNRGNGRTKTVMDKLLIRHWIAQFCAALLRSFL